MPATGALIGTPASMSDSEPPQTVAIDDEPFDSSTSETMRIVYGNSPSSGSTGEQRALGERAVADLAPARAAQELRLAGAEGREVVVQHELLVVLADQRVDLLLVRRRAERGDDQRLRLAAREERRAVRARQHPDLAGDRPDVGEAAAVDATAARATIGLADDLLLELVDQVADLLRASRDRRRRAPPCASSCAVVERGVALLLDASSRAPSRSFGSACSLHRGLERRVARRRLHRRASACRPPRAAPPAGRSAAATASCAAKSASSSSASGSMRAPPSTMTMASRLAGDDEVQVAVGELRRGGIDHELAADAADADGRDRAVPRDVRQGQRRRRAARARSCRDRSPGRATARWR